MGLKHGTLYRDKPRTPQGPYLLVDALTLGKNINVAPLRCGARSFRLVKVFKFL